MMRELIMQHEYFFWGILLVLGILLFLCLLKACQGPTVADRLVAVNMMGTMIIVVIGVLTVIMDAGYLADICMIYAAVSFLAVIVLTKVIQGIYKEQNLMENHDAVMDEESSDEEDIPEEFRL